MTKLPSCLYTAGLAGVTLSVVVALTALSLAVGIAGFVSLLESVL